MSAVGEMRDRVTFQAVTYASSTQSGQGAASFATLATVWASVRAGGGSEQLSAESVTSQVVYEIEIRRRADVTPGVRATWSQFRSAALLAEVLAVYPHPTMTDRMIVQCGVTE